MKKTRKTRLWYFDPSIFQPGPKGSFFERHGLGPSRSIAKYTLYGLALSYPLILVTMGVMFGGLVFWSALVGSVGLIWLVITKTGYAANFAGWDVGYRKFVGLAGAFGIALGLVYGLIYIGLWTIPIFGIVLVIALLGVYRLSNK
jgi:hypothetical protein